MRRVTVVAVLLGLLGLLSTARNVLLEGQPVAFTNEVMLPRVKVEDEGSEVVVTVHADPRISEVVSPGVARCGEVVCALGETELTGPWLLLLPSVRRYQSTQLGELMDAPWPQVDDAALESDEIELMLQIGGKLRGAIRVPATAGRGAIEAAALASPEFARFSEGRAAKKVVVVPGRLVNVVV